jgi:hypothetical protein
VARIEIFGDEKIAVLLSKQIFPIISTRGRNLVKYLCCLTHAWLPFRRDAMARMIAGRSKDAL